MRATLTNVVPPSSRRLPAEREAERVFQMSPALLAVAGLDGYLRRFNPAFEVFGYSREELLSRPWIEFAHPDDRERMMDAARSLGHGADVVELENRVVCRDGSVRWVQWSTRVVPEEGLFLAAGRDVTESRRAAEEQAALRRVAMLVARQTAPDEVFAAVAREIGELVDVDATQMGRYDPDHTVVSVAQWARYPGAGVPIGARFPLEGDSVSARVLRTGRSARMESYGDAEGVIAATVRGTPIRTSVGVPITVEGQPWGVMIASSRQERPFPAEMEARLRNFTELVATAIANTEARSQVDRLAEEQGRLRRVATLVARSVPQGEVFEAIAREAGQLVGVDAMHMGRYDDGAAVSVAGWSRAGDHLPVGTRVELDGTNVASLVWQTGRPARIDGYSPAEGGSADELRNRLGVYSSVAVPIVVDDRLWGLMIASSRQYQPLPADTESRLLGFTELAATAMSNAQARAEVETLAEEQAALRRVATLVAHESSPTEVFAAVAREAAKNLGSGAVGMLRFEPDGTATLVAQSDTPWDPPPLGTRFTLEGENVVAAVQRARKAVRLDDWANASGAVAEMARVLGIRSSVATPIIVEGRLWGTMIAVTDQAEPLPADTESRLGQFTELVATAIANAAARAELARLADEQAALRRVATLVAQGARPGAVFDAVTAEAAGVLGASAVALGRYDDDMLTVLACRGTDASGVRPGDRVLVDGVSATAIVRRTGRAARVDHFEHGGGAIAEIARRGGVRSTVATPVVVDGRTWGVLAASWTDRGPPPEDTEQRMSRFAELLDTAIANADSRDQLAASRARVLAAGDEARRRVVRDLHDGAQQRLVHTTLTLKLAQRALQQDPASAEALMAEALQNTERATAELRELAHGILPSVLTLGGLRFGVDAFVSRLDLPVLVDVPSERLPPDIEASAYFIVAEALTNVVKHAQATRAEVRVRLDDGVLAIEVHDDGVGGADPQGHGLVGITDRIDALGGRLHIHSDHGTTLIAELPLPTHEPTRAGSPPNATPSAVNRE